MTKERRLGRGLEALLGRLPDQNEQPAAEPGPYEGATTDPYDDGAIAEPSGPLDQPQLPAREGLQRIDVREIDSNPFQPRKDFDESEMQSLTDSLTAHGLLQPVVVRRVDDRYQLIAGERRLRAATQAGWTDLPVNVVEADERETAELAIVENLQRKDLNPLEKAASFQRYLQQYGCTQDELAARLKLDRSTIANLIRLLELPEPVHAAIRGGQITQGHARALLPLGEEREQIDFCRRIQRESLSVRQTETAVQQAIEAAEGNTLAVVDRDGRTRRVQSDHLAALEEELRLALGTKVKLTQSTRGRGKLVIHFRNHQEFERLREQLTAPTRPAVQDQAG